MYVEIDHLELTINQVAAVHYACELQVLQCYPIAVVAEGNEPGILCHLSFKGVGDTGLPGARQAPDIREGPLHCRLPMR